jgi:hypothetical protein
LKLHSFLFLIFSFVSFGAAYYIETDFDETEVPNLQYAQADNEMYLVSGTDIPQVLTRTAHNAWTITDMTMETGPFMPENTTATTITPSATTGTITLEASSSIFQSAAGASHIGSIWQISQKREISQYSGDIAANGSEMAGGTGDDYSVAFRGEYTFITDGTWEGTITLERCPDDKDPTEAANWEPALTPMSKTNYNNVGENEPDGAYYRVTASGWVSGTCDYYFTIADQWNHGVVEITAVTDGDTATAEVITDLENTDATTKWREGYWSDYRGWPKTVCFHQQRLIFGGSTSFPQTLWFGQQDPDEYYNFTEGTLDTDAFTAALPGQNPIRWLLSGDYLFIGTSGSTGYYGEKGKSITPTSPNYSQQSIGSDDIMAVFANDTVLYVERGSEKVREFQYSLPVEKYLSADLTLLAEDITDSGIKEIAFQQRPIPVLWCVLNNGDIATMTYQKDQAVVGWGLQSTDGDFESAATIPGTTEDEVWFVVKRTIGGTDYRYVEQLQPMDWGTDDEDAWFVDSGLDYDAGATDTFAGLDHLEGESVQVYADGAILGDETVTSGEITIDTASSRVIVGLPFTAKLETMPLSFDPRDTVFNKQILRLWVDLYETGDLSYGYGTEALTNLDFDEIRTTNIALDDYSFPYGPRGKATIYLESGEPVPVTIRRIQPELEPIKVD